MEKINELRIRVMSLGDPICSMGALHTELKHLLTSNKKLSRQEIIGLVNELDAALSRIENIKALALEESK